MFSSFRRCIGDFNRIVQEAGFASGENLVRFTFIIWNTFYEETTRRELGIYCKNR